MLHPACNLRRISPLVAISVAAHPEGTSRVHTSSRGHQAHFSLADDQFVELKDYASNIDPREQGRIIELISGSLSNATDVHIGICRFEPGDYHLKHHHPRGSEWYLILGGEADVHLGGVDHHAERGSVFYIPAGVTHSLRAKGTETTELLFGISHPEYADIGLVYDE
jgi:quercetin dioxygenase-like cupin family protein